MSGLPSLVDIIIPRVDYASIWGVCSHICRMAGRIFPCRHDVLISGIRGNIFCNQAVGSIRQYLIVNARSKPIMGKISSNLACADLGKCAYGCISMYHSQPKRASVRIYLSKQERVDVRSYNRCRSRNGHRSWSQGGRNMHRSKMDYGKRSMCRDFLREGIWMMRKNEITKTDKEKNKRGAASVLHNSFYLQYKIVVRLSSRSTQICMR